MCPYLFAAPGMSVAKLCGSGSGFVMLVASWPLRRSGGRACAGSLCS